MPIRVSGKLLTASIVCGDQSVGAFIERPVVICIISLREIEHRRKGKQRSLTYGRGVEIIRRRQSGVHQTVDLSDTVILPPYSQLVVV